MRLFPTVPGSVLSAALLLSTAFPAAAQQAVAPATHDEGTAAVFHKSFFISFQKASLSGVPVSYQRGHLNDLGGTPVTSSGSGTVFGVGVSGLFGDNNVLLQIGYDQATARFTDWRVKNRPITFSAVDLTGGYAFRGPIAIVPYFSFAPGWYRQGQYVHYAFNYGAVDSSGYEALQDFDYNLSLALGAKAGFLRHFALNAETRWYWEDTGGGSGCPANTVCIDLTDHPRPKTYGMRTSLGVQLYWGW